MKSKIFIFLLFISSYCFGQSVPNTDTFSLQNVYNAVDNHTPATTEDLQSCFNNAISGYFNATYNQDSYAPANSMLRFRDYKPTDCTTYPSTSFTVAIISPYNGINTLTDFTGSLSAAQSACTIFNQSYQSGDGAGLVAYRVESLTIGKQLYSNDSLCDLITVNGYYIHGALWGGLINNGDGPTQLVYILNGIIQSITACP